MKSRMGVGVVEGRRWRLVDEETVDWMKMENGQGKVVRLVVAPSPWQPHPPSARGGPSPLGPAGTPLEPALTHSTSGAVTGSNARLGTSKDLSSGHGTPYQDTFVSTIYAARAIVARRPQLLRLPARCSLLHAPYRRLDRFIPGGSFLDLGGAAPTEGTLAGDLGDPAAPPPNRPTTPRSPPRSLSTTLYVVVPKTTYRTACTE